MTTGVPTLGPDLERLRADARAFADEVIAPGAAERDRRKEFPTAVLKAAAAKGYWGILVPESYGGMAAGNLGQSVILEEFARADASTHVTLSVHNSLVCGPLMAYGSESLKAAWLPKLASGEALGGYALTEPHAGSDAASLSCTAVRDGDSWVLNGTKMWITTGTQCDVLLLFARTDREAPKAKGISAFIVPRRLPGLTAGKPENKLGIRASETVQLFLENVRIPADSLIGEVNRGFNYAMETLNGGRVGIAVQAVGIAQRIVDETAAFLRDRVRHGEKGRTTQDEDFRLAEMATKVDAARLLCWRAAELRDQKRDHVREASMAKLFATQSCNEIARAAVELVGPAAISGGHVVERLFRDARITELYEGTTEVQKLVIARTYLR